MACVNIVLILNIVKLHLEMQVCQISHYGHGTIVIQFEDPRNDWNIPNFEGMHALSGHLPYVVS